MPQGEEELKSCEACGATIYPEHLKSHTADVWHDKLLCKHCLEEKRQLEAVNPAAAFADENTAETPNESITLLVDEEGASAQPAKPTAIRAFGASAAGGTPFATAGTETQYQRPLDPNSPYATRCRTFHCKLNDASVAHLNEMINEWADGQQDVRIKFANTCIGTVEGKSSSDPNLFVTVFY